jgi:hypothetical protein
MRRIFILFLATLLVVGGCKTNQSYTKQTVVAKMDRYKEKQRKANKMRRKRNENKAKSRGIGFWETHHPLTQNVNSKKGKYPNKKNK